MLENMKATGKDFWLATVGNGNSNFGKIKEWNKKAE